jgi:hypothetical protein
MARFTQQHDPQRVIKFRVGQEDAVDGDVSELDRGPGRQPGKLVSNVR